MKRILVFVLIGICAIYFYEQRTGRDLFVGSSVRSAATFIDGATGTGFATGLTGGFAGGFPDSNNGEVMWGCYAWPLQAGSSGNRVFFINQEGDLLQFANRQGLYNGAALAPPFDAVYSVAGDVGSPLGINGVAANNAQVWTVVQ